ncbi:TetR/AcrR family transcriptional regulator [Nonomuraea ferruginea]|uniref:TetR/AcrR family transcriptional regulator n=1 Tax=Nonomuraea ferruginea TaxID=46174 RepID=UPI003610E34A
MRKDALHNRERLLEAARQLFADRGLEVPLEEIARRAEVSIGTLYNRFPSRDDLVEAVFADRVAAVRELAERSLAADDAWEGFVAFLTGVCELQSVDLGYNDLAVRSVGGHPRGGRVDAADRGAGPGGRDVAAGCDAGGHGVRDLGGWRARYGRPSGPRPGRGAGTWLSPSTACARARPIPCPSRR